MKPAPGLVALNQIHESMWKILKVCLNQITAKTFQLKMDSKYNFCKTVYIIFQTRKFEKTTFL